MLVAQKICSFDDIMSEHHDDLSPAEKALLLDICHIIKRNHDGQYRASGEPYISHPISVYLMARYLGMPFEICLAALLHDGIEDCPELDEDKIRNDCGELIAWLVVGMTKDPFDKKGYFKKIMRYVIEKGFWGVIILKLADRLHNLVTLNGFESVERRARVCDETINEMGELVEGCRPGIPEEYLERYDMLWESVLALATYRQQECEALLSDQVAV